MSGSVRDESASTFANVLKVVRPFVFGGAVAGATVSFVVLASWNIHLPGLYADEVIQAAPALRLVTGNPSIEVTSMGRSVGFGTHRLQIMTMGYIGTVKTLVFAPVIAAFGAGPIPIRCTTIGIAALAIVFMALFARRFAGPVAAAVAALLLAFDPSYLVFCRTDYGPTACMMAIKAFVLWQLAVWWQTSRTQSLYFAAFAAGVGVYDKVNFLWVIGALVCAAFCIYGPKLVRRAPIKGWLISAALFALGCVPLIYFNLHWPLPTLAALKAQNTVSAPTDTGPVARRVMTRLRLLPELLEGAHVPYVWILPAPKLKVVPWLLSIAGVVTVIGFVRPSTRANWSREAFLLLNIVFIVLFATLTPGGDKPHHLILTYPFPHLIIAAVVAHLVCIAAERRAALAYATALAVALLPIAAGVSRWQQIRTALHATGGQGVWSDVIYPLADWLRSQRADRKVVAADWGIWQPLACLTGGKLPITERSYHSSVEDFEKFLDDPKVCFCFHAPDFTNTPSAHEQLSEAVANRHRTLDVVKTFHDRTGKPILIVAEAN